MAVLQVEAWSASCVATPREATPRGWTAARRPTLRRRRPRLAPALSGVSLWQSSTVMVTVRGLLCATSPAVASAVFACPLPAFLPVCLLDSTLCSISLLVFQLSNLFRFYQTAFHCFFHDLSCGGVCLPVSLPVCLCLLPPRAHPNLSFSWRSCFLLAATFHLHRLCCSLMLTLLPITLLFFIMYFPLLFSVPIIPPLHRASVCTALPYPASPCM